MKSIAILGASEKEGRYSRIAQELLMEKGYKVFPVTPRFESVLGVKCFSSISDITEDIDTLTIYVNPKRLAVEIDQIIAKKIRRVIFNPGTESPELEKKLAESGKEIVHACTIIMLKTGQF